MKLEAEFIKLPLKFDVDRLQQEILQIPSQDWIEHPNKFKGNKSIPLISARGEVNDDYFGPMAVTEALKKLPYVQQVIASFPETFGRSRLMLLESGCEVTEHSDINYHWYRHVRVHIPIVTTPDVIFHCGDESLHMRCGETWIFDAWKLHRVENHSDETRIHLVLDICGSRNFWDLVNSSDKYPIEKYPRNSVPKKDIFIPFKPEVTPIIKTENFNVSVVMHPGEVEGLVFDLIEDIKINDQNDKHLARMFRYRLTQFCYDWRELWLKYGEREEGWLFYQDIINHMITLDSTIALGSIDVNAKQVFYARVLVAVLNPELFQAYQQHEFMDSALNHHVESRHSENETHHDTPDKKTDLTSRQSRNSLCGCGSGKRYKHCCAR